MTTVRATIVFLAVTLSVSPSRGSEAKLGQMCWTHGVADRQVYYAENYVDGDRSESFEALMEFTGVYRLPTICLLAEAGDFEARRDHLFREWAARGLKAVNTTFLSDLDY